jgi:hypothetical protein
MGAKATFETFHRTKRAASVVVSEVPDGISVTINDGRSANILYPFRQVSTSALTLLYPLAPAVQSALISHRYLQSCHILFHLETRRLLLS